MQKTGMQELKTTNNLMTISELFITLSDTGSKRMLPLNGSTESGGKGHSGRRGQRQVIGT